VPKGKVDFRFCIQDPTDPDTEYLYEAIIGEALGASKWRGMYAFSSRGGVDQLITDPAVEAFLQRGGVIDLIVGIDAVTNRGTLERLQELAHHHLGRFLPRVFWNETSGLFHPKLSYFGYEDGNETLIVGSGNLTPGGLRHNFEGYCVMRSNRAAPLDMSSYDEFLGRHAANLREIDNDALERAARNLIRPIAKAVTPKAGPLIKGKPAVPIVAKAVAKELDRFLISQVPKAGGRWAQAHFNADVIRDFFRVTDIEKQRVYLTRVTVAGDRGEEEVRPVIYSEFNKNYKIELGAAKGLAYPATGAPIVVLRERQIRGFDYMLLLPGNVGYAAMHTLSTTLPKVGKGLARVITDSATVAGAWSGCPLLSAPTEAEKEI
jgi:hypothetical protein